MKKTTYWKDVWRTFVASKGRMLSIALLMALGSFALKLQRACSGAEHRLHPRQFRDAAGAENT